MLKCLNAVAAGELDPLYVDITIRRWQKLTGNKACHAGDNRAFDDLAAAHEELAA